MLKVLNLCVALLLLSNMFVSGQNNTSSPYSRYGIGDIANKQFGQNMAMGGASIGTRTPYHLNITNPASYSALDSLSFVFEFGVTNKMTRLQSGGLEYNGNNVNLSYLAIAFPVTRWMYGSAGLLPFSNVGYNIKSTYELPSSGTVESYYVGSGGVNQFYFGTSLQPFKHMSIGVNASYLFGFLKQTNTALFPDDDKALNFQEENNTEIADFYLNYGFQYYNKLNEKYSYTIGLNFDNKSKIDASNSITKVLMSGTDKVSIDNNNRPGSFIDTLKYIVDEENFIELPQNIGFGVSLSSDKIVWAADYSRQNWAETTFLGRSDSLKNSDRIAMGFEFTPGHKSFNKYWKRVRYRFGGHYSNTPLYINGEQLNEFGISFGVGLPIKKSKTTFNITFEFGQRGTTDKNLIKENYALINLNLSLHDNWFRKQKFN